jgi:hypothetical protein
MHRYLLAGVTLLLLCGLAGCVVEAPRRPVAVVAPVYVRPAPAVIVRP